MSRDVAGPKPDELAVVEAAYAVELDEKTWLERIAAAAAGAIGGARGVIANTYDVTSPGDVRILAVQHGTPAGFFEFFQRTSTQLDETYVRRAYLNGVRCAMASEFPGFDQLEFVKSGEVASWGLADDLVLRGWNPGGRGVTLNVFMPRRVRLTAARRAHLSRLASHMGAGHRLRAVLRGRPSADPAAEAILDGSGRVHHAEGAAKAQAVRAQLTRAVIDIERSRGTMRRDEPEKALRRWKAMVAARWSLIDEFQEGDRHYVVACKNVPDVSEPEVLSVRERQVVAMAAAGHSNKLIAYELGIAPSTVRVLLSRSMAKLAVRSRAELVERAVAWALPSARRGQ